MILSTYKMLETKFAECKDYVFVDNKKTLELLNFTYELYFENILHENLKLVKAPIDEEYIERKHIIEKSKIFTGLYMYKDINSRRSSFVNNYDEYENHCISYLHFYCRNDRLNFNVYCRSMNFDTNFIFDNQTFFLAYKTAYDELIKYKDFKYGSIYVHVMSLHRIL